MMTTKRSIGVIYDVAYPFVEGGGQRRIFEVGKRLVCRGWQVNWYCFKTWEGADVRRHEGISYHGLAGFSDLYTGTGRRSIREAVSFGWSVLKENRRLRKYSVLWCGQWPYFHLFAISLGGSFGKVPVVIDWWETWGNHWYEYLGWAGIGGRATENAAAKLGDYTVCISRMGFRDYLGIGGNPQKSCVIPNGIDFNLIASVPPDDEKNDVVFLGRLKKHKNVDHLIKAVKILKDRGKPVRAQIIGDGPEKDSLIGLSSKLGVSDSVVFLDDLSSNEKVYQRLKAASIFVNPSTKEGGGSLTLFEANACGLPVIAYEHKLGIDSELIDSKKNGRWVTDMSPEGLANSISEMFSDPEALAVMKRSSAVESSRYDWSCITDEYENIFSRYATGAAELSR